MPVSRRRAVKTLLAVAAASDAALPALAADTNADVYVSPRGDDRWSGRLKAPNRAKTDGPFLTLARAQRAVRERTDKTKPARVLVRGGFYPLTEPLAFTADDSGTATAPVVYSAYPGETPVISGGVRITGWKNTGANRYETTVRASVGYFEQLYVNGQRRFRPRLPKEGYYFIAGEVAASPKTEGKAFDRFRFKSGEIRADFANRADVEVLPFHIWTMDRHRIADIDEKERIVTFAGQTMSTQYFTALPKGARYLLENVKEALSKPGQWYLDRPTRTLTYLARPGEDPDKWEFVAPRLAALLTVSGAQHITFDGLTFAHAAWLSPPTGQQFWQAESNLGAAVTVTGARNVTFDGCRIRNVGAWAIDFRGGSRNCRLVNSELTDLGAGGIKIGEIDMLPAEKATGAITVSDCLIAHGGRIHNAGIGIWIGHADHNTLTHNEIVDFYYTGISPGWSWGYGASGAHHNEIAYNHIHLIGQGVLSDMGGIYTLGVSPGTVLHHNRIHDINSFSYGGWGIYFDEGTTGVVARDNVVYRTKSAPFHQHYGRDNLVENNVFAFGTEAQLMRTRPEEHLSFTLRRNLVYYTEGPLLGSNWTGTDKNFRLENNLYFNAAGRPVTFPGGLTLAQWQEKGLDKGSRVADPGFVAPQKGNFALRPDSPAIGFGFKPIGLKNVGRRNARPYLGKAEAAFPPPPPPRPIADDFEDYAPGDKPGDANVFEEASTPAATIRITSETASSGKQSLKITDAPGQQFTYNPHLHYSPTFDEGILVGSFALRHEPGAIVVHEWRDANNPYHTGPALRIAADGKIFAGEREIVRLASSQWLQFTITCALGKKANGKYNLVITTPGDVKIIFPDLACVSPDFNALRWWGWISNANQVSAFYLDDVSLLPER